MSSKAGGAILRVAIGSRRRDLLLASAAMTSHQICEALVPLLIGLIIDRAVDHGSTGTLLWWLGGLLVLFAVLSNSYRFGARWLRKAVKGSEHDLRMLLTDRVLAAHGLRPAPHSGEVLSLATNDAQRVGMIHTAIAMSASAVGALAVAAVVLLRVSIPMGLLILLGMPPLLWLLHRLAAPLTARGSAEQEGVARSTAVATDLLRGLRVLKGIGAERVAASRYRAASSRSLASTVRSVEFEAAYDGLNTAVNGVFVAAVALLGGWFAAEDRISIGDLIAAVGLTSFLIGPFFRITRSAAVLALARGSAARIADLLATPQSVRSGAGAPPDRGGALRLEGLHAGPVTGLDLTVGAGELLGLVVPDPVAAGALLDRLARKQDPDLGRILLDGADLTGLDLHEVRSRLLVAGHDADLFEGTVRQNVLAAAPADRLEPAVLASATDEVASSLADGLQTPIAARGTSLSGGQRQRVALARALAADPAVLVLHDPTTAVDAATEARIAAAVRAERSGRTTVVITTSPAWLAVADRVVVIGPATRVGEGTHADLVRTDPVYRETVLQ